MVIYCSIEKCAFIKESYKNTKELQDSFTVTMKYNALLKRPTKRWSFIEALTIKTNMKALDF